MTRFFNALLDPQGVDVLGLQVYVPLNPNVKVKSLGSRSCTSI